MLNHKLWDSSLQQHRRQGVTTCQGITRGANYFEKVPGGKHKLEN